MTPSRLAGVPGLALCIAVALFAMGLEKIEVELVSQSYVEALVLAILIGVAIRTLWSPGPRWLPGIDFSAKILLEIAVVLLGAALSASTVLALGPLLLVGIVVVVIFAIASSYVICRALGLRQKMAILIACGNSICGNSAIAAVAPVIGADSDDVASSIAFTAVLGVVVVLLLPLLVPLLQLSLTQYGVLAGLTVYAVPQVLAATLPIGALSNQVGTVVKLVRVLMLGPVVLGLSLAAGRLRDSDGSRDKGPANKLPLHQLVPWFIVGFLLVAMIRSLGLIPIAWIKPIAGIASVMTTISMAGLGLGVDVRVVAKAGLPVSIAVTLSLIVLALISYGVILVAGVA
ncbi:MAG: putative sulfate exporter family transporter [Tardiphaga sp.]